MHHIKAKRTYLDGCVNVSHKAIRGKKANCPSAQSVDQAQNQ